MRSATRHLLQEGALWAAAVLGLAALVYFFNDIRAFLGPGNDPTMPSVAVLTDSADNSAPRFSGEVRLKADRNGHFVFEGAIDDRPLTFMADTGASMVALTYEDARRAGLSPHSLDFTARVSTANGVAYVAPVTLNRVRVGDITLRNVRAAVAEKDALETNLLGMSFLGRLKSFHIRGDELILIE